MTEINKYLKHTVDIVTVTYAEGSRTITTALGIPAFIAQRRRIVKDVAGDHEESETVVYLKASQTIARQDEITFDGETRSIKSIWKPRNLKGVNHIRVTLS